jgi:hypothetical protein
MKTGVSFPLRIDGGDDRYPLRLQMPTRRTHKLEIITLKSSTEKKRRFAEKKKDAN